MENYLATALPFSLNLQEFSEIALSENNAVFRNFLTIELAAHGNHNPGRCKPLKKTPLPLDS